MQSAKISDCEMAATCYCSLSVIVFKEHQSHRTLPCFDRESAAAFILRCWQSASLFCALQWFISVNTLKLSVSVAYILKCFTQLLNKPFISIRLSGLCNKPLCD